MGPQAGQSSSEKRKAATSVSSTFAGMNTKAMRTVFALVGEEAVPYDLELDGMKLEK